MPARLSRLLVGALLLLGLCVRAERLYHAHHIGVPLDGDARIRYDPLARNLAAGHGFSVSPSPPYLPNTVDQPGYPLFVAALYRLAGGSRTSVVAAQLLAELLALLCVFAVARRFGLPEGWAWLAVVIGVLCSFIVSAATTVMTETLATLLLTATALALTGRGLKAWALAGLLAGVTLSVRPDTVTSLALMFAAALWLDRRRSPLFPALAFAAAIILVLAPWTARNFVLTGRVRPLGRVTEQLSLPYIKWLDTWVVVVLQKIFWPQLVAPMSM